VVVVKLREPVNALTHLLGALLSVAGLVMLVVRAAEKGTVWHVVSFAVFGASLLALYSASTLYHSLRLSPRGMLALRQVDHMMIFLLIAGTYTPFTLVPLRGALGWTLFGIIWGCAAVGMGSKLFWMNLPRWIYTGAYVVMGWMVVAAIYPLLLSASVSVVAWLIAGGLLYTAGAVLYATKWPNPFPGRFGFHEIWHLFVMAGSLSHYTAVSLLI
jgi:hemolysin III